MYLHQRINLNKTEERYFLDPLISKSFKLCVCMYTGSANNTGFKISLVRIVLVTSLQLQIYRVQQLHSKLQINRFMYTEVRCVKKIVLKQ